MEGVQFTVTTVSYPPATEQQQIKKERNIKMKMLPDLNSACVP